MAGRSRAQEDTRLTGIQVQTSGLGGPIPKVWGTTRISGNLVWYGDFRSTPANTGARAGGKGLAGSAAGRNSTYEYSAAVIMALCEGPIAGVGAVWRGKDKASLADLGLAVTLGQPGQTPWSYLTSYNTPTNWARDSRLGYADRYTGQISPFADQAIGYSATAYLSSARYSLGTDGAVPNHGVEVRGSHIQVGALDADPADVIRDLVTSTQYGLGLPATTVGDLTAYSDFCVASGLLVSPALTRQISASEFIDDLAASTHAELVWSDGQLRVIPLGDEVIAANGRTFVPQLTPLYDLTANDYLGGQDPIQVTRSSLADAVNRVSVEFRDRVSQYNDAVVVADDQAAIDRYGLNAASSVSAPWFCAAPAARMSAQLALQRGLGDRNTYQVTVNARFAALEPGDIVTLTDEGLGLDRAPVRITRVDETTGGYSLEARDLAVGTAAAATIVHDSGLRWQTSVQTPPALVQAPLIFELPASQSVTGLAIGVAVAGQLNDPLYGGCRLWVSMDGSSYQSVGVLYGGSRYGTVSTGISASPSGAVVPGPLGLIVSSGGQLLSGTAADAEAGATLIAVKGEFVGYETATLTGVNAYSLSNLHRGLYNSDAPAIASGATWARVDQNIFRLEDIDPANIGKTIHVKITAFNAYGGGEHSLADAVDYAYTITGSAYNNREIDPIILAGLRSAKTYYQATPPVDGVAGNYWTDTDNFNRLYRHDGLGLTIGGVALTIGGVTLDAPWVQISDLQITLALDRISTTERNIADAQSALTAIASDGVLSQGEKPEITRQVRALSGAHAGLVSGAAALGITTELSTYNSAYSVLLSLLAGLSPAYDDVSANTPVPVPGFGDAFVSVYSARTSLQTAIDTAASQRAVWSGVTGMGRPADNADVTLAQPVVSRLSPISGRAADTFSSATGMPFATIAAFGEVRDGDVVAFSPSLPNVPRVIFFEGGVVPPAGNVVRKLPLGLTTSGFTAFLKSQTVSAGATIADTGASAGGAGNPGLVINRSDAGAPFDSRWVFTTTVDIGSTLVSGGVRIPGSITIAAYLRVGGVWLECACATFAGSSVPGVLTRSAMLTATATAVDFGAGPEFGVSVIRSEGVGTALVAFDSVQYTLGTTVDTSLTPSESSPIPWIALL